MPLDLRWAWVTLLCLVFAIPLFVTKADPDLWGHTRYGIDILQTRLLPLEDPYSFTQDRPWINHEWLSEVLMGAAYLVGGAAGLIVLKTAVVALAFLLIAQGLGAIHPVATGALVGLSIAATPNVVGTVRPQIWTFLGLVILVRLIQSGRHRWCPLLFAAWINLHGGWIVGFAVLSAWCGTSAIQQWWERRVIAWELLLIPLASFLATLLNPYGWTMWTFMASTVRFSRDIQEWQPIYVTMPTGLAGMTIALVLACWAHAKRETRPALPWTAVLCVLVYGSVRVTRVAALAAPLAILIVGPALANWSILKTWRPQAPSRAAAALTILPLFVVAIFVFRAVAPLVSCIPLEGAWIPDTRSGQVLTHSAMPGRLVTLFGWGQYAIWHFGPQLRVSWDGRRETVL